MRIFICPGSFDPVTNGHIDIIERSLKLCDKLIVAVGCNYNKKNIFTVDERVDFLKRSLKGKKNIEIERFSGLLTEYAVKKGACAIIKGLRALSDFEYEFQMALLNKSISHNIETLFMMTSMNYSYISSSAVRELAAVGGDLKGLVPEGICSDIVKKLYINNK